MLIGCNHSTLVCRVLNQPANFAAVITEGRRGSINKSRPARRRSADGEIEPTYGWILGEVLQDRFQRIGSSGSAGECAKEGVGEGEGRQDVRNGRGEAETGRNVCARVLHAHACVLQARGEARGRGGGGWGGWSVRRRARERKPGAGGGGADGGRGERGAQEWIAEFLE